MVCCSAWGQGANIGLNEYTNGAKMEIVTQVMTFLVLSRPLRPLAYPLTALFSPPFAALRAVLVAYGWKLSAVHLPSTPSASSGLLFL